jgi:uncharacterized membrane protein
MGTSPLLLFFLIVGGWILIIVAFSIIRRIESMLSTFPLSQLASRIYQLEKKLDELQRLAASPAPTGSPTAQTAATPPPPSFAPPLATVTLEENVPTSPPPMSPQTPPAAGAPVSPQTLFPTLPKIPPRSPSVDLENLIGGRWFNRIGIIALLFAVSYFLKLAFDNNWIGPAGRVTIGIILGALMLPWSQWLLRRDYTYFSEGIAGLGEATLFVSVWAGCQYYTLYTRADGFIALVLVTCVMALLALLRNSERIAFLSLLGGLLMPALMSTGRNEQISLFTYLLLLGAAALFVVWRKTWHTLLPLAFFGTQLYFWQWYDIFYTRSGFLQRTLFFANLFFLLYSVIPVIRLLRRIELPNVDLLLVFANASAYSIALYVLLWPDERGMLTFFFLALSVAHLIVALVLADSGSPGSSAARTLCAGLATILFTLAIPIRFDGNAITLAFAVEGAALVAAGFHYFQKLLRPAGYLLLAISAERLLSQPPPAETFLLNQRFGSYLLFLAGLGFALWVAELHSSSSKDPERIEIAALSVATNLFALIALTLEFWDYFGLRSTFVENSLAQHLSVSILWTAYAGVLIFLGIQRHSPLLRWQALFLLGVVVVKVFFYDLSFLDRVYRILSFFILGSALLAVSFLYQRKIARDRPDS